MVIKSKDIKNKPLARLTSVLKLTEIDLIKSITLNTTIHSLYKVGNILAIAINENVVTEWDEEFDHIYAKYFHSQTSRK